MRPQIDFQRLNDALLQQVETLLARWLPSGIERNGRWYVGDFDGSPGESANVNMATGQWIDNAAPDEDVGRDLISLYARIHNMGNAEAAHALMQELGWERPSDEAYRPSPARSQASAPSTPAAGADAPPAADQAPAPASAGGGKREPKWRAITPVPAHAPAPQFVFGFKDKSKPGHPWVKLDAVRTWPYVFDGQLYGHVARFERISSDGELVKDTVPLTWCTNLEDERGLQRWHWKTWEAPRPLYVPAGGFADQARPVVLVEGEKCALAGHELLGAEFDFVSWPGGCKTWHYAAWAWLQGRTVYLWPDCDAQRARLSAAEREAGVNKATKPVLPAHKQPGMQAMVNVGTELAARQGCTVHMCQIPAPGAVGDGWDIADAIAQGWDAEQLRAFIRKALPFTPATDEARTAAGISTASIAAAEDAGEAIAWRKALIEGRDGAKAVRENAALAMDGLTLDNGRRVLGADALHGLFAYNEFSNNVELTRRAPWGTMPGAVGEADDLELGDHLSRSLYLPPMGRQTLEEAISMVARRHAFHPPRRHFESLRGTWDNTRRLGTWLMRCCRLDGLALEGEDESDRIARLMDLADHDMLGKYLARVGTWVLMAIVARVLKPGCKFDYMMVLEGGQGMFKSTTAKVLGLDWFSDTGLVLGDKDSYQNLQGKLVYEWAELASLSRAEVQKVKQFISSECDRFRASFDRRARDYPRQVVFIGTTNEAHYLTDSTGNRRFWPVRVERPVDLAWLRENLQQLYAEALHYVDAGNRFHPTHREQQELFDPQQSARMVEDSLETAIRCYLYDDDQKVPHGALNGSLRVDLTLNELLNAIGISLDKQTEAMSKKAGAVMGRLGWERARRSAKVDEARPWVYRRPPRPTGQPPAPPAVPTAPSGSQGSTGAAQPHDSSETADDCPF
jgi:predicted P-loop ATPase